MVPSHTHTLLWVQRLVNNKQSGYSSEDIVQWLYCEVQKFQNVHVVFKFNKICSNHYGFYIFYFLHILHDITLCNRYFSPKTSGVKLKKYTFPALWNIYEGLTIIFLSGIGYLNILIRFVVKKFGGDTCYKGILGPGQNWPGPYSEGAEYEQYVRVKKEPTNS